MVLLTCRGHACKRPGSVLLPLILGLHIGTAFCLKPDETAVRSIQIKVTSQEANVTIVTTSEGLFQAIREGHAHIELREHIFLTHPDKPMYLGVVPDTVKSIRGNCDHLPPGKKWKWTGAAPGMEAAVGKTRHRYSGPRRPLVPRQCMITTMRGLMVVIGHVWVDGIYMRRRSKHLPESGEKFTGVHVTGAGRLWATHVTIQGDKRFHTEALKVESKAFCDNTLIADHRSTSGVSSPINVTFGATLSLLDSAITATNTMHRVGDPLTGAAVSAYTASNVRLEGCSFQDNKVAHTLEELHDDTLQPATARTEGLLEAKLFSDSDFMVWTDKRQVADGQEQEKATRPLDSETLGSRFLSSESRWFIDVQRVLYSRVLGELPSIDRLVPPPTPPSTSSNDTLLEPPTVMGGQSDATADRHNLQEHNKPAAVSAQTQVNGLNLQQKGLTLEHDSLRVNSKMGSVPSVRSGATETPVNTAEELVKAFEAGHKHIVLQSHLDLSDQDSDCLSIIPDTVQSLRGNCECPPNGRFELASAHNGFPCGVSSASPAPLPLKIRQCVIKVQPGGLRVVGRLLMEGIYIKQTTVNDEQDASAIVQVHGAGQLYMKHVTLQGMGGISTGTQSIHVFSEAYGQGIVVAHVDSEQAAVISAEVGATLSLNNSCMHHAEASGTFTGLVHLGEQAKLRLQAFSMHDNHAVTPDQVHLGHCVPQQMHPLQEIPSETRFLSTSDLEAAMLQRGLIPIDRETVPDCGTKRSWIMYLCSWAGVYGLLEDRVANVRSQLGGWVSGMRKQISGLCEWVMHFIHSVPALVGPARVGPDIQEVHDGQRRAILPPGRHEPIHDFDEDVEVIDISKEEEGASSPRMEEPLLPDHQEKDGHGCSQ